MPKRRRDLDFRGNLQAEVMSAIWKLGEGTVEDVRQQQAQRRRSAYTTIQTVMNRLVERGLLTRRRRGNAYVYRAEYDEGAYLARTIGDRLADASPEARRSALVNLVESLEPGERQEVARYARRIRRTRSKRD
ncbi:MAG: BlaI/MecI/CopY family transcriptional regulator [Thermoleophilaceae bacterium]|nr:BlaI/MecI/CopY family transcriptional regulator [Thermoleophilaceae bacterium]